MLKLSYEQTIEVLKEYGNDMYWYFYDIDPLYAGMETQAHIKSLKVNPIGDKEEMLDLKAKDDYIKGRV